MKCVIFQRGRYYMGQDNFLGFNSWSSRDCDAMVFKTVSQARVRAASCIVGEVKFVLLKGGKNEK